MPRKTRKSSLQNTRKSQLLFREPPLNGAVHQPGPEVRSAPNTKPLLLSGKPQNRSTSSWVTSEFDTTMHLRLPARQGGIGRKKGLSGRSVLNRSSLLPLPQLKKNSVCKFPALSFNKNIATQAKCPSLTCGTKAIHPLAGIPEHKLIAISPDVQGGEDMKTPKQDSSRNMSVRDKRGCKVTAVSTVSSTRGREVRRTLTAYTGGEKEGPACTVTPALRSNHQQGVQNAFTPPDLQTPESQVDRSRSAIGCLLPSKLLFLPPTPPVTVKEDILVRDTPEQYYGLKNTWRRRKELAKFLKERGQLSSAESHVGS